MPRESEKHWWEMIHFYEQYIDIYKWGAQPPTTLDGRNPTPVDMVYIYIIMFLTGFLTSRWLFGISSINSSDLRFRGGATAGSCQARALAGR